MHRWHWKSFYEVTAAKMPTLDDIIEGATNKSKRQLQEALLGLLKGNPDILDLVTKSKTKTLQDKNEVVSLFLWLYITIRNTKSLSFRKALPWNFYKGILLIASVCIFSIMVFIHFLWYRQGEYDQQSRSFCVGGHFLYCHNLDVWFSFYIIKRN